MISWLEVDGLRPVRHVVKKDGLISPIKQTEPISHVSFSAEIKRARVHPGRANPEDVIEQYLENSNESSKSKVEASRIMKSPVITTTAEAPISSVIDLIKLHHYHHFPVLSKDEELVGMICERDILRGVPNPDHTDTAIVNSGKRIVSDIMSTKLLIANTDTSIKQLGLAMVHEGVSCIPIVDDDLSLVGIVTSSDMLKSLVEHGHLNIFQ